MIKIVQTKKNKSQQKYNVFKADPLLLHLYYLIYLKIALSVPRGGLNKGILIPLTFACPKDCECASQEERNWHHAKCGDPSYITQYGDIICKNHLENCSGYFIKDAQFQCNKAKQSNTWHKHNDMAKLLTSLGLAVQAAQFNAADAQSINTFTQSILTEVGKRWYN